MIFIHGHFLISSTSEQELKDFAPQEWHARWEWRDTMPQIFLNPDWVPQALELGAAPITPTQVSTLVALWEAKFNVTNGFYP